MNSEVEVFKHHFYVFSANPEEDEFSKSECGYLLFFDKGSPFLYHNGFLWAENLPKEYQINLLPVIVTFNYTGDSCEDYHTINIIKIEKNQKQ